MILTALLGLGLLGAPVLVGCDRTVEEKKTVEQKSDGTKVEKSKSVEQKPNGDTVEHNKEQVTKP